MRKPMKSSFLSLALAAAFVSSAQAQAALPAGSLDAQLMNSCNARMDARMEGMSQAELDHVRMAEFALRMALAPFRADPSSMSEQDRGLATADLARARRSFASACGLQLGAVR